MKKQNVSKNRQKIPGKTRVKNLQSAKSRSGARKQFEQEFLKYAEKQIEGTDSKRKSVRKSSKRIDQIAVVTKGRGANKNQVTLTFPNIAENRKVDFVRNWKGEELQYYINKNRPVKGAGYKAPQAVYIKLVKRKPRGKELFFSSQLSPSDFIVNRKNTVAFAAGVLENYYNTFETDKGKTDPYKRHDSSPDDYEGKPMKVVAIIFHFLY